MYSLHTYPFGLGFTLTLGVCGGHWYKQTNVTHSLWTLDKHFSQSFCASGLFPGLGEKNTTAARAVANPCIFVY